MKKYSIKNWSEYNKSLIQRGSITLWFSEESINQWYSKSHTCKNGRPRIYSDEAIQCALLLRIVFNLSLRALEGYLHSLIGMLGLTIDIPSYTQICRRAKSLGKGLKKLSDKRPTDIVFDSTGLKVYGEGEWKVRQHGKSKRRVWRKLHLAIDLNSQEIILGELSESFKGDGEIGRRMLKKIPRSVKRAYGDGAYDGSEFRKELENIKAKPIIPPPRNAIYHGAQEGFLKERDDAVLEIMSLGNTVQARKAWKKLKGYHKRSLVETGVYRLKQLTGSHLRSREWVRQQIEAQLKCLIVNRMTRLGMPLGVWEEVA